MSPSEPFQAFAPVANAFDALGAAYFISGSIASVQYGMPRSTMDIDVVAELEPEYVDRFVSMLGDDYYAVVETIRDAVLRHGSFNIIHLPTMFKVDVFVAPVDAFQASMRDRAAAARPSDADRAYPIATAEDVILSKLRWYREGGGTSEKQWSDIKSIIQVQGDRLDRNYLQKWAKHLNLMPFLERVLRDADQ